MVFKSKEWVYVEKRGGLRIQGADVSMAKKKVREIGVETEAEEEWPAREKET